MAEVVQDLVDAIAHVALHGLAFTEHLPCHGVERVVVHPHERAAQQVDAVEDETAGNRGLATAEIAFGLAQANRAGVATEVEGMPHASGDAGQDRQIEIDHVPAGQHVGIEGPDAVAELGERSGFARAARSLVWHFAVAAVDDQDLVDAGPIHRDRKQPVGPGVRLDVERQYARIDPDVRRAQRRIVEDPRDGLAGARFALDRAARLDAAVDEMAHGKANVSLERVDACRMQPVTQCRHVPRKSDFEAAHRGAVEGSLVDRRRRGRAGYAGPFDIDGADVEAWSLAIVPCEERRAVFQPAMDVNHRAAASIRLLHDAVACLRNETAHIHSNGCRDTRISHRRRRRVPAHRRDALARISRVLSRGARALARRWP